MFLLIRQVTSAVMKQTQNQFLKLPVASAQCNDNFIKNNQLII